MHKVLLFGSLPLLTCACAHTVGGPASTADRDEFPEAIMNRNIADRFPGATMLGEAEFAEAVVGGSFSYREVGSELVLQRPKEVFAAGGQYRIHWARSVSYGTWSFAGGIVSIDCADCRYAFIALSRERVFFRHQGRLLTANASGEGKAVELIRDP